MKTISFIIPAHNAADVLERAVCSIARAANNLEYEVIIVENGSEDCTREVAGLLSKKDPHVMTAHSDEGVSCARNEGLRLASGKWIAFLDADDFYSEEASMLFSDAETSDVDLVMYGHIRGQRKHKVTERPSGEVFSGSWQIEELRIRMLQEPTRYMQVWAKLFRRSVIEANRLRFRTDLRLAEDSDFTFRFSRYCRNVYLSPACILHYSVSADSVMHTEDGKKVRDYAKAMQYMVRETQEQRESGVIQKAVNAYILNHFNIAMVREVFVNPDDSYYKKRIRMLSACRISVFRRAILHVSARDARKLRLLPAVFLKYHLPDLAAILFALRVRQNRQEEQRSRETRKESGNGSER